MSAMADRLNEVKLETLIEISDKEYNMIKDYVYKTIGINLGDEKKTLLSGRLQKLLRKYSFASFTEYYDFVSRDKTGEALSELADNISTNHTFFYREPSHFEFFKNEFLPQLIKTKIENKSNDIRVWCAGCSTGEEPYMLVMLMMEVLGNDYSKYLAGILATDISSRALMKAQKGVYSEDSLKKIPINMVSKYFKKLPSGDYEVIDRVKKEVTFRRFNLMNQTFPFKKPFDAIFCRNVMIYFDLETRNALIEKFYNQTVENGLLFIGHSETINKNHTKYRYVMPAMYIK